MVVQWGVLLQLQRLVPVEEAPTAGLIPVMLVLFGLHSARRRVQKRD